METANVVVWVLIDEGGEYVAGDDGDTIHERYDELVGNDRDTLNMRRVKITLTVPLPRPVRPASSRPNRSGAS